MERTGNSGGKTREPYKKRLNLRKLIIKDDTFDPKLATIDDPEFRIVLESLREPIGYDSAICELSQMHHVSERTAKTWYAALKPAAEAILALEKDATKSLSNKND